MPGSFARSPFHKEWARWPELRRAFPARSAPGWDAASSRRRAPYRHLVQRYHVTHPRHFQLRRQTLVALPPVATEVGFAEKRSLREIRLPKDCVAIADDLFRREFALRNEVPS